MQKNKESDDYNPFVFNTMKQVCTATIPNDPQWMVNRLFEGLTVLLKLKTGSNVKIPPLKRKLEIKPTNIQLTSYTGDI